VAARAGVSLATVSRVMNGNASVDHALAARVRAAAVELNYSASPVARSLVLGKTNTVAVVIPDLGNPSFHGILRGLSRAAAANGFHILIADSAESVVEEMVLAVQTRRRCDGLVLCAPRMPDAVRVPEDISVVGFDDIPFARYLTPPLTTASVPGAELGRYAWQRIWDLLNHRPPGHAIFLRPRIESRGSAGPVQISEAVTDQPNRRLT